MDMLYQATHSSPVKRKVLGDINNTAESPISPTANLKLLTKVASQCDLIENACLQALTETPPNSKPGRINQQKREQILQAKGYRKFKSLGFLCDKFLMLFPLEVPEDKQYGIKLSDLAQTLGVEKRRIYDIINVVESLQMATKIGKNSYAWTGHKKLAETLSHLKAFAQQMGLDKYVQRQQMSCNLYTHLHEGDEDVLNTSFIEKNSNIFGFFRNERRIGILCQKFVMLFLVSLKGGLVNLELAAQVLVGEACQQNKTRLRRLYDIANILVSLGVIAKLDISGGWKKPVFRYVGPPLHHLDGFNTENPIFSDLVKTELCDSINSDDVSEDSSEKCWQPEATQTHSLLPESDHSYSLDVSKATEKTPDIAEPVAKKRLVFTADCTARASLLLLNPSSSPIRKTVRLVSSQATIKTKSATLRILSKSSEPQPITNGGLYKAVRVGNDIQLIRIDS